MIVTYSSPNTMCHI